MQKGVASAMFVVDCAFLAKHKGFRIGKPGVVEARSRRVREDTRAMTSAPFPWLVVLLGMSLRPNIGVGLWHTGGGLATVYEVHHRGSLTESGSETHTHSCIGERMCLGTLIRKTSGVKGA